MIPISTGTVFEETGPSTVEEPRETEHLLTSAFRFSAGRAYISGVLPVASGSPRTKYATSATALRMEALPPQALPPLDAGMVNVTGEGALYRLLPHGTVFRDDINIVLPYDTALLPQGFTPDDIQTYYYNEQYGRWMVIDRDTVDETAQLVYSKVNHFTDFINAVIKTPEMPETAAYTPTSIKELKAANPLEGLQLMQPPTANNNGTANMSYPLELPAGRQGMQPNLALTYSSGGGNGWLGVGWDISIPSITVETRWGVPRYDSQKESEVYVLEGEQLVNKDADGNYRAMPHRTNQWVNRLNGDVQFYPRKNEAFDSIVRHGTGPANYWWSVTDRNGITHYYGKQKDSNAVDYGSVLCDPATHHIAHWALTESVDPNGNSVRYYYEVVQHSGIQGSAVLGRQIYIDSIAYTCRGTEHGKYSVCFHRKATDRQDVIIAGNKGFKEVTAATLCYVEIKYDNEFRSLYALITENNRNSFYKTRLTDIVKVDSIVKWTGQCLGLLQGEGLVAGNWYGTRTHFDYYDAPSASEMFGAATTVQFTNSDNIHSDFLTQGGTFGSEGEATALGATKGKSWSMGATASVGVGFNVCMSTISVGGNFDHSRSQSEGALTLIDLDGDGLSDKVFKENDKLYYRKQQMNSNGQSFSFGAKKEIEGLTDFLQESSATTTWGLQASAGVSYSGSWPTTTSTTTTYFADVNGDGLPDLITENGVLFNVTENDTVKFKSYYTIAAENTQNHTDPETVTVPSTPCGGIIFDGEVNDSIACETVLTLDTVYPFKTSDDLACIPMDSLLNTGEYECVVNEAKSIVTVYKKSVRCEPVALDPDMDAVKVWIAPRTGYVKIHSAFRQVEDTSYSRRQSKYADGVRYTIQLNRDNYALGRHLVSASTGELLAHAIDKEDYSLHIDDTTMSIQAGDMLFFRLQSQGNREFDKVNWQQTIIYNPNPDTSFVYNVFANPDVHGINADYYNSENDFIVSGQQYFQAADTGLALVHIDIQTETVLQPAYLWVLYRPLGQSNYTTYSIPITSNVDTVQSLSPLITYPGDSIRFYLGARNYGQIHISPKIKFYPIAVNSAIRDTVTYYPPVTSIILNYLGTPVDSLQHRLFGPLYRGWGQFAYNNNDTAGSLITDLIDVTKLLTDSVMYSSNPADTMSIYGIPNANSLATQEEASQSFQTQGMYNPLSQKTRWVEMTPDSRHEAWIGYGNINYITRRLMTNTRMPDMTANPETVDIVEYDHPVPVSQQGEEIKTVRKQNRSQLKNNSLTIGIPVLPISYGNSQSNGDNTVLTDYMDLNGDRYPDVIGEVNVQYSTPWGGIGTLQPLSQQVQGISSSETSSKGQTFGASYSLPSRGTSNNPKNAKISFNGSGNVGASLGDGTDNTAYSWMDVNGDGLQAAPYNRTFSKDSVQLTDINGDGYIDYVTSSDENAMTVRYNTAGKTNLLKTVTHFTGSTIALDYDMPLSSYEKPQRSWNLAKIVTCDSLSPLSGDSSFTTFAYAHPHYDRYERMDYGYDTVITRQYNTQGSVVLYRYTVAGYDNDHFNKRGRKLSETVFDAQGNPFVETLYDAALADIASGLLVGDADCPSEVFVKLETEITNYYEGHASPSLTTAISREYDAKRNVIRYINYGDTSHRAEYLQADILYTAGMAHNLIALPQQIEVRDFNGNLLRKRTAAYNNDGKMTHIAQYNGSQFSEIDLTYDSYGNALRFTLPQNSNGQRIYYDYQYDTVLHCLPIRVSSALGYYSSAEYDYKYAKPTRTVDINGNEMRYLYDFMGRLTTIWAPDEIEDSAAYTIQMEYYPCHYGETNIFTPATQPYSYARTYHYDPQHPQNPIATTLLCDGLGRLLQTKKDAEIGSQEVSLVTGKVVYDCFGRTVAQYHPFTEPLANYAAYNGYFAANTLTTTRFDVMDRQTRIQLPTGDTTAMAYDFGTYGGNTYFKNTTTDAKGNTLRALTGSRKQQIQTIAPGNITTSFVYNALGELLSSTDPDGISTDYDYDMLGQRVSRKHPDAGTDTYSYDAAGNLTKHITQILSNLNETIDYVYNYNQLTEIHYPENPENNVYYTYGAMGATYNRAGKIMMQEDASGWQIFYYGKLGEITGNIRTFALPNETQPYTFAMKFEYDSWNRVQNIVYPDGEKVHYDYNLGGMLQSVVGDKGAQHFVYVKDIAYNAFELKKVVKYGNGAKTYYKYDILQRLLNLRSLNGAGEAMQDIDYKYDAVSNITAIYNSAGVLSNGLGGTYSNSYSYDNLYRLDNAAGQWNGSQTCSYTLDMDYLPNGRIKKKEQRATTLLEGVYSQNNYVNFYTYNSSKPNTLARINDSNSGATQDFEWDANGNLVFHHAEVPALDRRLCWDEENRLMGVKDDKYTSYYQYDAAGERTYKLTGEQHSQRINGRWYTYAVLDNATLYTSPYLVATEKGYTKHYYAESERIASKIGGENFRLTIFDFRMNKLSSNEEYFEHNIMAGGILSTQYHTLPSSHNRQSKIENRQSYHPDHLGSSSWITYSDGKSIQHLHYLPFGESFVDQRISSFGARYTFSAKEKDTETGYGYFGARYYSSDLSIWLSVDPMAEKYPTMSPYVYCADNPIKLVDPDGREVEVVANENGTYTVIGGTLNSDKSIYIMKDGKRSGTLGQSLTEYSFFNEEGNAVIGAIINPKDNSGKDFISDIKSHDPGLMSYANNARLNQCYDYKNIGGSSTLNNYRGMPISENNDGSTIYASARDIGNFTAGYVAGRSGISWKTTRFFFDAYQTTSQNGFQSVFSKNWSCESMVSQSAQKQGYNAGVKQNHLDIRYQMETFGPMVPHLRK